MVSLSPGGSSSLHNEFSTLLNTAIHNVGNWVLQISTVVSCNDKILVSCSSFTDHTTINTFFGSIDYIPFKLGNYIVFNVQQNLSHCPPGVDCLLMNSCILWYSNSLQFICEELDFGC